MQSSPKHSDEYIDRRELMLEALDGMMHAERELVWEYGLNENTYPIIRQYYGRWEDARRLLEEQRKALQVQRWRNINIRS